MTQFLIVLAIAVLFLSLAFLGLAVKGFFKKGAQLKTCGGENSEEACGCGAQTTSCTSGTE